MKLFYLPAIPQIKGSLKAASDDAKDGSGQKI